MTDTAFDSRFLDLELAVEVWLAAEQIPLSRLLELELGDVLALAHDPDGPVDLVVNGTTVATGELVVVDGRFGFRVSENAGAGVDPAAVVAAAVAPQPAAITASDILPGADEAAGAHKEPDDAP